MTARPDAPVSDERLAEMVERLDEHLGPSRQEMDDIASLLRELQRLRAGRVPVEPIVIEREPGDD